ncbi:MAG TPA: ABATE domain-containing protein [Terriglobales bacterium]
MKKPSTQDFQFVAGNLALDFVNTVGNRLGTSRDYLSTLAELNRWARLATLLPQRPSLTLNTRQLEKIRCIREELYRLFLPLASSSRLPAASLAKLNERFARVAHKRQLRSEKNGVVWIWDTRTDDADYILAPVLLSSTTLLAEHLFPKIRQCQGDTCGWLFLDRSPSGHRRWCSMSDCGNRAKASRHYRNNKGRSS